MADRELLGKVVRKVWLEWAHEQPNPKPSWLLPWDSLAELDKEVDRRIGETIASFILEPMEQAVATLTREREEAIERADEAVLELNRLAGCVQRARSIFWSLPVSFDGDWQIETMAEAVSAEFTRRSDGMLRNAQTINEYQAEVSRQVNRADRAEAQLAEAQRALEIDRHALSAMQRDLDQSRREAERLRAALGEIAKAGATGPDAAEFGDDISGWDNSGDIHSHGVECGINSMAAIARAALNPPAEVKDEKYPQPNP